MPLASVMATESEVFGSCVGEIDVSVEKKNRCDRLCCGCKFLRIIFGGESGSKSAVEMGDGARYRKYFLVLYRYFGSY